MNRRILSLDPGTRNTGYCVLLQRDKWWRLLEAGCIPATKGTSLEKMFEMLSGVRQLITRLYPPVNEVWLELYVPYGARSMMMEMISLVGGIFTLCTLLPKGRRRGQVANNLKVRGIESSRWKRKIKQGKKLTKQDIAEKLSDLNVDYVGVDIEKFNSHAWDAVGIALYAIENKEGYSEQWVTQ